MDKGPLILAAASVIGALLIVSALTKIRDPRTFRKIVAEYPIFAGHSGAAYAVSRGVPWVEFTLGLLLLSSRADLARVGFCGALVFLSLATLALAHRAAGGERKIRCGCGSDPDETHSLILLLLRNSLLLAIVTGGLVFPRTVTAPQPADQSVVWCAMGFGVVLTFKLLHAAWAAREAANEWRVAG